MNINLPRNAQVITEATNGVIFSISDKAANDANMAAIDQLVRVTKYRHIVAWGKMLGFTPQTVQNSVNEAEADNAPEDAIQKIDGQWLRVGDIANDSNRQRTNDLARLPPVAE
jgi:hypothetical protein